MNLFWQNAQKKQAVEDIPEAGNNDQGLGYKVPSNPINIGNSLVGFVARNRENQLESRPLIDPEKLNNYPLFKEMLDNSNFSWLRKRIAYDASVKGGKFAAYIPFNGKYILDALDIKDYHRIGKHTLWVELFTSETFIYNDVEYPVFYKIWVNNGIAILDKQIVVETKKEVVTYTIEAESHTYKGENWLSIPGDVFFANTLRVSDVEAGGMGAAVEHLNFHSNELTTEWLSVLTRIRNNESFSDLTDQQLFEMIIKGKRIIPENSFNNKLSAGQEVFTSGSNSITFNQLNINFLEDKLLKYIGVIRESTSTGANKHSLEITLQNQYATEVLYAIRDMRELNYKVIADDFSRLSGEESASDDIELKVSIIEEAKLALLEESVEAAKAKGSVKNQGGN